MTFTCRQETPGRLRTRDIDRCSGCHKAVRAMRKTLQTLNAQAAEGRPGEERHHTSAPPMAAWAKKEPRARTPSAACSMRLRERGVDWSSSSASSNSSSCAASLLLEISFRSGAAACAGVMR